METFSTSWNELWYASDGFVAIYCWRTVISSLGAHTHTHKHCLVVTENTISSDKLKRSSSKFELEFKVYCLSDVIKNDTTCSSCHRRNESTTQLPNGGSHHQHLSCWQYSKTSINRALGKYIPKYPFITGLLVLLLAMQVVQDTPPATQSMTNVVGWDVFRWGMLILMMQG